AIGEPFPLVLLDGHMPEMDGFMLAEKITASPALRGSTLLMLTSAGQPEDVERCRELGIRAFLTKPVKKSELLAMILRHFGQPGTSPEPAGSTSRLPRLKPLDVLLAEDNAINQKLVVGVMGKQGHRVSVVPNGREAVAAVAGHRYDVVLMDVQMPEMDGLDATRKIRTLLGKGPHIVAMTANAMQGDREQCLAAGMDDYVTKPIRVERLVEALNQAKARDDS
ncbi:MAG: response regulator, partial [Burkholderiales bacterium]